MTEMAPGLHGEDWYRHARCKDIDPDIMFIPGADQNKSKLLCKDCPVILDCLAEALDNHLEFGVWGGKTERERRAMLRQNPDVASWRNLLIAQVALRQAEQE